METGYTHITFVLDKSGSMYSKKEDILKSFNDLLTKQKLLQEGRCTMSMYLFNEKIERVYDFLDVKEIPLLKRSDFMTDGLTALNDAIGKAIDETGEHLANLDEDKRPSSVMIVIMTDGLENASEKFTRDKVKEMIEHQESKYQWNFMYIGAEMLDDSQAQSYNLSNKVYSDSYDKIYQNINAFVSTSRTFSNSSALEIAREELEASNAELTKAYEVKLGVKIVDKN